MAVAMAVAIAALVGALLAPGVAAAEAPRPTADPAAPTPTSPYPGRPPQGEAPDGSTVGGEDLDARGVVVDDDAPPLPAGLAAAGWLVADAETGEVLAARDPHGRYYPASTLKTLTLLTLLPVLDQREVVAATAEDEQVEGSRVGIVVGGRYTVGLLFQALILQSGNDAANALARTAGGVEETVEAMNETAEELGAFDTVAGSPSGLDVAGQSSSPYDLALIFRALLEEPGAVEILRTPTAQMPPVPNRSPGYQIQNENPLLANYPGAIGGKTGFTDAARHTFVGAAERGDRVLLVSVMDTENVPLRAAEQAALLLDWGFALPDDVDGVGELVDPGEVPTEAPITTIPAPTVAPPVVPAEQPAAAAAGDDDSPLVPLALGGTAVLIVAATLIGRRRALRPAPSRSAPSAPRADRPAPGSTGPVSPPPPTGGSPSTRP
jgi:serine-type D-Ala-D-Ala carboxypeptidase (penicillin-binding protein 5/6)